MQPERREHLGPLFPEHPGGLDPNSRNPAAELAGHRRGSKPSATETSIRSKPGASPERLREGDVQERGGSGALAAEDPGDRGLPRSPAAPDRTGSPTSTPSRSAASRGSAMPPRKNSSAENRAAPRSAKRKEPERASTPGLRSAPPTRRRPRLRRAAGTTGAAFSTPGVPATVGQAASGRFPASSIQPETTRSAFPERTSRLASSASSAARFRSWTDRTAPTPREIAAICSSASAGAARTRAGAARRRRRITASSPWTK